MGLDYTVSARGKDRDIVSWLDSYPVALHEIRSVFGFAEYMPLYGGRAFRKPELSQQDVRQLSLSDIGIRLPLTNHKPTLEEYKQSTAVLRKYHAEGNSVILVNDTLNAWIAEDFPRYEREASAIKNTDSVRKASEAYEAYDVVVIPAKMNDDKAFLAGLPAEKTRIFANAGCAYNCPAKICYPSFSAFNKGLGKELRCSMGKRHRPDMGLVFFDVSKFREMGFRKFKMVPVQ